MPSWHYVEKTTFAGGYDLHDSNIKKTGEKKPKNYR